MLRSPFLNVSRSCERSYNARPLDVAVTNRPKVEAMLHKDSGCCLEPDQGSDTRTVTSFAICRKKRFYKLVVQDLPVQTLRLLPRARLASLGDDRAEARCET